ncbi:hypothetical protein P3S68_023425 [Capsicum galapagoense]
MSENLEIMAEILFNLAAEILGSLGSLAAAEVGSIYGLAGELHKFFATVSFIQAVLIDVEEHQVTSQQVKDWITRLKKVFFAADDLLDDVATEVKHRKLFNKKKSNIEDLLIRWVSLIRKNRMEKIIESGGGKKHDYLQLDAVQNDELRKILDGKIYVVAEVSGSVHQHKLGDLSKEDSWTLFGKMTFGCNKESKNSNLVEIGKEIVRKCGGIPLAIRSDLIDMWIAQGFIQSTTSNRDDVEDVANSYFMDLLRRSFFQETEEHEFPFFQETELHSPYFYKMHDLIHDLAKEVAGREFFSIIKAEDTEIIPDQTLHTSCLFKIDDSSSFPNSFYRKHMKLHTFIYLNGSPNSVISNSTLERMISSFARLRVLHLRHLQIKFLPQALGGLKHLRYLSISSTSIFNLPNSITNLHNLQILNLICCFKLKKLPRDIWRLVSLRCLDFKHCSSLEDMPPGIGQLTPLRTLTSFIIDKESCIFGLASDKLNELKGLVNLRNSLSIKFMGRTLWMMVDLFIGFCRKCQKLPLLWKLSSLQSLELRYLNGPEDLSLDSFEGLATMPEDVFKNLRSLQSLSIRNCRNLVSLSTCLTHLTSPENLCIENCPQLEFVVRLDKIMSLPIRHFSGTLKSIDVTECPNFATIPDRIGDLIALNRLAIDDSPMLKSLPEGMQSLTALQKLIVIGGSSILKQRFKKEVGEDWPKIAHVPTVDIDDDWN